MNKSLIIIALTLLQCACANQEPVQGGSASLLGFEAISAEITVAYEIPEGKDDLSQNVPINAVK